MGQLSDSKPCCMCINLMKQFHVDRVYYSNEKGEICCQKLNQYEETVTDMYVSHGLTLMIKCCRNQIRTQKIPLTKAQKKHLFT